MESSPLSSLQSDGLQLKGELSGLFCYFPSIIDADGHIPNNAHTMDTWNIVFDEAGKPWNFKDPSSSADSVGC